MALYSAELLDPESGLNNVKLTSGQILSNIHKDGDCLNEYCAFHEPSDHEYWEFPLAFTGVYMVRIIQTFEKPNIQTIEISGIPGHHLVIVDPDDYKYNHYRKALIRNSGYCPNCKDHLVSKNIHDYKSCSCGQSFVDGGSDYMRRTPGILDTSIVFTLPELGE